MLLYRPTWTCGRFNQQNKIAIFYNLIEGYAYSFESYSAEVIGVILRVSKGSSFSVEDISDKTNISIESLQPFIEELIQLGLISHHPISDRMVQDYRVKIKGLNHLKFNTTIQKSKNSEYPIEMSDAELFYHEKTDCISSVMLELTYSCSAKCVHCYNIGASRGNGEINMRGMTKIQGIERYKNIIDQFIEQGVAKVCLTGGDPFSYPFIWELLDYLYNKDIAIDIYTNGIIPLGHENRIAAYFPRTVCVSLYSGDKSVHDCITRVDGSWEKTTEFIKHLVSLAVPIIIKCCIMRPNFKSYHTVKQIADELGLPVQFDINVTDSVDGDKCVSSFLRLTPEMFELVLQDSEVALSLSNNNIVPNKAIQSDISPCMAGHRTFCVTPNGKLIPCCAFHLEIGDLAKDKLADILVDNEILKKLLAIKMSDMYECGKHDYCSMCCLCVGLNYSEHGNYLLAAENCCYLAKIRYGLLKHNGKNTVASEVELRQRISQIRNEISPLQKIGIKNKDK